MKHGDIYSWLYAAIKVLSCNEISAPYLPKGESLKLGTSLVFAGERIMRDWAMKKAVFLAARVTAGDLDAAQSNAVGSDESESSSFFDSSNCSGSEDESEDGDDDTEERNDSEIKDGESDFHSPSSRGSCKTKPSSRSSAQASFGEESSSVSEEEQDDSDEDSDVSSVGERSSKGMNRSSRVEFSIGTRIKQQNEVRHVLTDDVALAADILELEEESRLNMIRQRREAAKSKQKEKQTKKSRGKKNRKKKLPKTSSKSAFQESGSSEPKRVQLVKKEKKHRRRRRRRIRVDINETDEQKELRQLLMVRDAIIKSSKPLREGPDRIYRTFKMAASAIIAGVRSYRATTFFFFRYKPPSELQAADMPPRKRMMKVVQLFRQFLPAGFLVDFGALNFVVEFSSFNC
jgi:hypothetical protein